MAKTDDNAIYVGEGENRIKLGLLIMNEGKPFLKIKKGRKWVIVTPEQLLDLIEQAKKNI